MRNNAFIAGLVLLLFVLGSCKKDNTTATPKKFLVSKLTDSLTNFTIKFIYDSKNNLVTFDAGSTVFSFFYNEKNQIILRKSYNSGGLDGVDSFFYDSYNHISRIHKWDAAMNYAGEVIFSYDDQLRMNGVTQIMNATVQNRILDFEYNGTQLSKISTYVYTGSSYKRNSELEYFAYDSVANPFNSIMRNYMADYTGQIYFFFDSYANNAKSVRQLNYDPATGDLLSLTAITLEYSYNSNKQISRLHSGSPGVSFLFHTEYIEAQ
ncbi:MAG: hypothetical protein U0T73_06800 [Chitinophagales bacterium]